MSNKHLQRQSENQVLHWVSEKENNKVFTFRRIASAAVMAVCIALALYMMPAEADETKGQGAKTEESSGFFGIDFGSWFGSDSEKKKKVELPEDEKVWRKIKHSMDIDELNDFVRRFPDSELIKFAELRLRELSPSTETTFQQGEANEAEAEPEVAETAPEPENPTPAREEETQVSKVGDDHIEVRATYEPNNVSKAELDSSTDASEASESIVDDLQRVRVLQKELKRVGCEPGRTDGRWGYAGKEALGRFNKYADQDFDRENPTEDVIDVLLETRYRVCPSGSANETTVQNPVPSTQKKSVKKTAPTKVKPQLTPKQKQQLKAQQRKKAQQKKAWQAKQRKKKQAAAKRKKKKRTYASCMHEYGGQTARAAAMCQHLN